MEVFLVLKRKISLFLSIILIFSLSIFPANAVLLSEVDTDTIKTIYKTGKDERIVGADIAYPALCIVTEKDGEYFFNSSSDYGDTWIRVNLNEKLEGFIANGFFKSNSHYISRYIYGTDANGNLAIFKTSTLEGVSYDYGRYSDIKGEIVNMTFDGTNYILYCKDGEKEFVIKGADYSYGTKTEVDLMPSDKIIELNEMAAWLDANNLYVGSDGINWNKISLGQYIGNTSTVINYYLDDAICSQTEIFIVYKEYGTIKYAGIYLDENKEVFCEKFDDVSIDFDTFGYDAELYGNWGYPMLLVNDNASIVLLTKDAARASCKSGRTLWCEQTATPSTWAYSTIHEAAAKGILTPRTLPKNSYTDAISRELFCEYMYNLMCILNKADEMSFETVFTDTDNEAINGLASIGIINGVGNNKFAPDKNITRQEAAKVMSNVIKYIKPNFGADTSYRFIDENDIADWAKKDVRFVNALEIFVGDSGYFRPHGNLTVEQGIIVVHRVLEYIDMNSSNENGSVC